MFKFREANFADISALTELSGQLGYNISAEELGRRLEHLLQDADSKIYVAVSDSDLIGWIQVVREKPLYSQETALVLGLVIDHSYRNQGLGGLLLEQAEAWAKDQGFQGIVVKSNVIREKAHEFYLKKGYTLTKSQCVLSKVF